ncbi:TetR family transcriptional regulator [Gluconacetobacter sacchari DSM 12717]|uniref:TetR/AcrR family transcriptional regulator n=3 Tax=Gluconacetobacter sacchari TaxID=92759 RepID=A0A7W4NRH8_9PROT|nr:TetR/AcrR family transcriptional regulator [Gluconacetobacter sacchari]MBB2160993.1 TetR/AcrR family transcriptional regulator [Gluconacetobacter sacchari]GBQ24526.1 TetR family transcriptional regulator [Gluconacetobacter sacchari DSM 12717]
MHAASAVPNSDETAAQAERRQEILEVAAQLFAERGYKATSIRQIADAAGMMAGSLYYHIQSKESLFVEIHNRALDAAASRIFSAIAPHPSPWARLQAACVELLDIQLSLTSITLPLMNSIISAPPDVRSALIKKRDEFEAIFRNIIDDLPLPPTIDRDIYRILLLRVLNTASDWYRSGRMSHDQIAEQIFTIFKHQDLSDTDARTSTRAGSRAATAPGRSKVARRGGRPQHAP